MTNQATTTTARQRLRRDRADRAQAPSELGSKPSARSVIAAALWLGLLTGPAEVGLVVALKRLHDGTPGFLHMNRHIMWMIPLFHAVVFTSAGLLLALLAKLRSRFSMRRAAIFLGFLSLLSLALAVRSIHP